MLDNIKPVPRTFADCFKSALRDSEIQLAVGIVGVIMCGVWGQTVRFFLAWYVPVLSTIALVAPSEETA